MNNGVIEYDSPETIYRLPRTKFVAAVLKTFLCRKNGSRSLSDTNKSKVKTLILNQCYNDGGNSSEDIEIVSKRYC